MFNGRRFGACLVVIGLIVTVLFPALAQGDDRHETFDDPALSGWELSPQAAVNGGVLTLPAGERAFMLGEWQSFALTLRVRFTTELILAYRATDDGSYNLLIGPGYVVLGRELHSAATELAVGGFAPPEPSAWFELTLQVQGNQHVLSIADQPVLSVEDDGISSGGSIGFQPLGAGSAELDELIVTGAGEAATLPTAPESSAPTSANLPAYQAASWVRLGGPAGGVGYDIRHSFADPERWYVTDTNSGLNISPDRGNTWQRSNTGILHDPFDAYHVFSVTVDPHNSDIVWAGTRDAGHIYRSTDGGQTWEDRTANAATGAGVAYRGFTVDPRSSDIVYAMAEIPDIMFLEEDELPEYDRTPRDFAGGRIFKTEDSGLTWTRIWQGPALARYLWINPANPNELYASTGIFDRQALDFPAEGADGMNCGGVGILKSTDGGATWGWIGFDAGLTHLTIGSLYMHPQDPQTLLAGGGSDMCPPGPEVSGQERVYRHGGVYLTHDGGVSWRTVVQDDIITAVEFCAQNPQIAYAASRVRVYRSDDGGENWQSFGDPGRETWGPSGLQPGTPIDIQTDPADCNRVFINNYDGGNFLSTDGGQTWQNASLGYSGAFVWGIYVDPADAQHIIVATGMAPWESWDGGLTWQGKSNLQMPRGAMTLTVDPADPRHWLAQGGSQVVPMGGIYETRDSGASWSEVQPCQDKMRFAKMQFAPSDPNMVYASTGTPEHMEFYPPHFAEYDFTGRGVYRSTDGGHTWQAPTDPKLSATYVVGLAVSPSDPNTVYAGTLFGAGVLKSTDGGVSWTAINAGLPPQPGNFGVMAVDARDVVFAGSDTGLYRSTDQGATWQQLTAGLDPVANFEAIVFDPTNPDVIYAGTHNMGIYVSVDGGDQWRALNQGLNLAPGTHLKVFSLAISSDGRVLYAGSENFGVFRLGPP